MRSNKAPAIACLIAIAIILLVAKSWGAAFNKRLRFIGDYDSVKVVWAQKVADSSLFTDSIWVTSIPTDTFIAINDAYDWDIWYCYWSAGEEVSIGEFIKFTAGPATISSTDKGEMARMAADSVTVDHGAGLYGPGSGIGSDTLIYYASDTGNGTRVEGVQVSMYTIGGTQVGAKQLTDATGGNIWALNSGDTLLPVVYGPHTYLWELDTIIFTGQTTDSAMGWKMADPSAAAGVSYVTAYFDVGAAYIDSGTGLMATREQVDIYCELIGGKYLMGTTWALLPQIPPKRPDTSGRVRFFLPANGEIMPAGSYYQLSWRARDGYSMYGDVLRKFIVDTLPDPINIWEATEVY